MRPERDFGRIYHFASVENALAFLAYATQVTAPYARFVEITQSGTQVRVDVKVDSIGSRSYNGLSAQLLRVVSTFA
jgi:hypothetical protein